MKRLIASAIAIGILGAATVAFAYELKTANDEECNKDEPCIVYCDNGEKAGSMTWNGSVWSDGVRWDKDKHVVARAIVKANGSSCE